MRMWMPALLAVAGCGKAPVCGEDDFEGFDCSDDAAALAALEQRDDDIQAGLDQVEDDVASIQPSVDVEVITIPCPDAVERSEIEVGVNVYDEGFVGATNHAFVNPDLGLGEMVETFGALVNREGEVYVQCGENPTFPESAGIATYYSHHEVVVTWLAD